MKGSIVVLSGPSGSGKGTVYKEIQKRRKNVTKELSFTTREPRAEEENAVDYFFVTRQDFLNMKQKDLFLEDVEYDSELYGTLKLDMSKLEENTDVFFDKDVRGALKIKEAYDEAILIYLIPKDVETLIKRRGNRGNNRQQIAENEIELAKKLEWLVINDNIEDTVIQVENIIKCIKQNRIQNEKNIKFLDEFY